MRIEEIHVDGYGHLSGTRLSLGDGLVCILGDNEAGKSTLLGFVRSILFGFTHALSEEQRTHMGVDGRSAATSFDPVEGGNKGGSLIVVLQEGDTERRYRFTRTVVRHKEGELRIIDLTNNNEHNGEDAERLRRRLLGNIDAAVFGTVFALGLDELHALKSLGKNAVEGVLFAADAGIGADIATEIATLTDTMDKIWKPRAQKPRINALNRELKELEQTIREATDAAAAHRGDQEQYDRTKGRITSLEDARDQLLLDVDRATKREQARRILQQIEHAKSAHGGHGDEPLPRPDDRDEHQRLKAEHLKATEQHTEVEEEVTVLRHEQTRVHFDATDAEAATLLPTIPEDLDTLVTNALRYRSLAKDTSPDGHPYLPPHERERLERLDDRIEQTQADVDRYADRIDEAERHLELAENGILPADVEGRIRSLVRTDAAELERDHDRAYKRSEGARNDTTRAMQPLGPGWDRERIRAAPSDHATEAKILTGLLSEPSTDSRRAPSWPTVAVGILLITAGIAGLFNILLEPASGAVLVIAGLLVAAMGLRKDPAPRSSPQPEGRATKALAPYGLPAETTRDAFRGFIATLRTATERLAAESQATSEHAEISTRLNRLDAALRESATLIAVPPEGTTSEVQGRLQVALDASQKARAKAEADRSTLKEHKKEHEQTTRSLQTLIQERSALLNRCGIDSAHDDPAAIRQAIQWSIKHEEVLQEMETLKRDAERFATLERTVRRVQEARREPMPEADLFPQTLRHIASVCEAAATTRQRSERLASDLQKTEHRLGLITARLSSAKEDLASFYARFACDDEDGFKAALTTAEVVAEIDRMIRSQEEQLADLASSYPDLRADLDAIPTEEDAQLLVSQEERLHAIREGIRSLGVEAEKIYARLANIRDQDELTTLLQRKAVLEAEREEATRDWLQVAMTRKLLEKVRERYQQDHGPRVLQEAGQMIERITDGRYEAIRREPDGHYVLIRSDGRIVPAVPPHVSRATFAQVYLSIRLAYAEVNDEQGVPYLLDDVLSDFDDRRLERVVGVLSDLAKRRQVVLFTHHGHVAERLSAAGLTVTPLTTKGPQLQREIA